MLSLERDEGRRNLRQSENKDITKSIKDKINLMLMKAPMFKMKKATKEILQIKF